MRVEKCPGLQPVARGVPGLLADPAGVDRLLDRGHDQSGPELVETPVAELEDLGEVVAGVDVHHREREPCRPECLLGQPEHHDRVLAPREQQHRLFELGGHLPHDMDRVSLERPHIGQLVLSRRSQPPRRHEMPA